MKLTSKDIIDKYFEMKSLVPDILDWEEEKWIDNEPRYYRLKQLNSLFKAFSLGNFRDFEKGKFIRDIPIKKYDCLKKTVDNDLSNSNKKIRVDEFNYHRITFIFRKLISYLEIIYKAQYFGSGVLSANGYYYYPYYKFNVINKKISEEIKDILNILCSIISPDNLSFSEEELISKYNYPNIDLKEIDLENF